MANKIENEAEFDRILDELADGFGREERFKANEAGAKVFRHILKPKVPYSVLRKSEKVHLRDSLITEPHANGSVDVGFTKKGAKGYIGRFQNDGWDVVDRKGKRHSHVAGKHFWEESEREAKGKVGAAVAHELKKSMDRKVRGL